MKREYESPRIIVTFRDWEARGLTYDPCIPGWMRQAFGWAMGALARWRKSNAV